MTELVPQGEADFFAVAADPARCTAGFDDLLATLAVPGPVAAELRTRYTEPRRGYHNAAHVGLLWLCHLGHGGARDDFSMARAILFHDAIYDARAQDNEAKSAALLKALLPGDGWAEAAIRATADHIGYAGGDARVERLLDLDLSPLAEDAPIFARNTDGLRHEYAHVPEFMWRIGRRAVLGRFLNAPTLFRTALAKTYEARVRANLTQALAES